jgi:glutamyl-tRNA synthetase
LPWDETFAQSQRIEIYQKYFEKLVQSGRVYPCFETSEQLEVQRQDQLAKGLPPVYDREKGKNFPRHDAPYWRFALNRTAEVCWDDAIQGAMSYHARHLSDPVVMRQDGSMSYLLSSVIDDVDSKITHILRGADHLTNTAAQIQMIEALEGTMPIWAHFPLMFNEQGEKFSKRALSLTINELRQQGYLPLAIVQSLAQFGLSRSIGGSISKIAAEFSLSEYSKSNAKFSIHDVELAQSRLWASMSYDDLPESVREKTSEPVWPLVCDNIVTAEDIQYWQRVCQDHTLICQPLEDASLPENFLQLAAEILESSGAIESDHSANPSWIWSKDPWHTWIEALSQTFSGIKKGLLCKALRTVLTGRSGGPKMNSFLPMISPHITLLRLRGR